MAKLDAWADLADDTALGEGERALDQTLKRQLPGLGARNMGIVDH